MDADAAKSPTLLYPLSWKPVLNPYAGLVKRRATDWFQSLGIVFDKKTRVLLDEERTDLYGGFPYPVANFEHLTTVSEFVALWILFDDLAMESGGYWERHGLTIKDYELALRTGELSPRADPFLRAWWELGRRFAAKMSDRWMARLADYFVLWLEGARRERDTYSTLAASAELPDLATYLSIRTVTIGARPTFWFNEYAEGFELPDQVMDHSLMVLLHDLGTELIFLANDILSLGKDIGAGWPNVVTVLQRERGLELAESLEQAVRMHNDAVKQFVHTERALPSFGPDLDPLVRAYVERMHFVVRGFTEFELGAERYLFAHHHSAAQGGRSVGLSSFVEENRAA